MFRPTPTKIEKKPFIGLTGGGKGGLKMGTRLFSQHPKYVVTVCNVVIFTCLISRLCTSQLTTHVHNPLGNRVTKYGH